METKGDLTELIVSRLDRIESKLDAVKDHCSAIDVTLAKNTSDVAYHIKRSDALETRVEQVANDLKPVTEHVTKLKGAAWLIGLAVTALEAWHWWKP